MCICNDNGSSNDLLCYPPDKHQFHNAVYWTTGSDRGSHGTLINLYLYTTYEITFKRDNPQIIFENTYLHAYHWITVYKPVHVQTDRRINWTQADRQCWYSSSRWLCGVVGNAFRMKRSYCTPGPVSTVMGDCLRTGKPSRCETCQLGRLSFLPSVGW